MSKKCRNICRYVVIVVVRTTREERNVLVPRSCTRVNANAVDADKIINVI